MLFVEIILQTCGQTAMFIDLFIVSHYRDPQLQEGENHSYLLSLGPNICKF